MTNKKKYQKLFKDLDKDLKKLEAKFKKRYKEAYQEIKKDIEVLYLQFEKGGEIDFDKLKRLGQLDMVDIKVAQAIDGVYKDNTNYIHSYLMDSVKRADLVTLGVVKEIKAMPAVSINVEEILKDTVGGRVWTERMESHLGRASYDISTTVRAGMQEGKTYTQVAKDIAKYVDKDVTKPITIARYEGHRVMEAVKYERIKSITDRVPMSKTWLTSQDERVRSTHQPMEGVTVKYGEEFILPSGARCQYPGETGVPDEDIGCRCTVSYQLDKDQYNYDDDDETDADFY